jgi:hypothetical protein
MRKMVDIASSPAKDAPIASIAFPTLISTQLLAHPIREQEGDHTKKTKIQKDETTIRQ